ncbi:MAG: alkane 1-monooxygenase [Planctomycetes bacterium]|nr:alkane 1-monooxygenase [Planctomycetota bacterium]
MSALPYLFVYTLAAAFFVGQWLGGAWSLLALAYAFALVPLLEPVFGHDLDDPVEGAAANPLFDLVLRAWLPVQLAVLGGALWIASTQALSPLEWAGLIASTGTVVAGGGINVAHELMHRRARLDRALAELLMATASYTHFCVEHVHGHHRHVATPLDPASARLGESVYAFLPRTLWGGLASAWGIESRRVAKRGLRGLADRRLRYPLGLAALYAGVGLAFGPAGLGLFAAQSVFAILLLETINYVEHYGLERAELAPGRYERTQPRHSWNATHRLTNAMLFNLQRHADHHAFAHRRYPELRAWPDAPTLPCGYPTMVLAALVPPLWFALMNPRAAAARGTAVEAGARPGQPVPRAA